MNLRKIIKLLCLSLLVLSLPSKIYAADECFEKASRSIFKFNMLLDDAIIEPIAKGYNKLPKPLKDGTGNFTSNISTLLSIPTSLLQGNLNQFAHSSGSVLVNSTIGVLGFFNPAEKLGLKSSKEDFGQTLGSYGLGTGCYFVLPVLGPTTVRDTIGSLANFGGGDAWYNVTIAHDTKYFENSDYYYSRLTAGVDFRAKNLEAFDSLENSSMDLYASVRSLYLQDRKRKILNSDETTETMNDDDWEEIDSK